MSIVKRSRLYLLTLTALAAMGSSAAHAAPDIEFYGNVDLYLNHMRSSSGETVTTMEDGAMLRSRVGIKGGQDLTGTNDFFDYIRFQWEKGLRSDNGNDASGGGFDRQSWLGLGSKDWGELRFGRQGTVPFKIGSYIDGSGRTLGSMVNNFGVPSRYNNTIAYISPKFGDLSFEAQYSPSDAGAPATRAIYSAGVDWASGPIRAGYAGLLAKPADTIPDANRKNVAYHNIYGNYDYGQGKLYLVWVRSNNSNNAGGSILDNVGRGLNPTLITTGPEINDWHHIWQVAADYKLSNKITVGGILGLIEDQSDTSKADATGGSVFAYYDATDKTRFFAIFEILENEANANFGHNSSGGSDIGNFSGDRSIKGIQLGVRYKF